jgi:serine/threonine-protein kinase
MLTRDELAELAALFDEVVDLDGPSREATLGARCASRRAFRAELDALLAAHARADGFLNTASAARAVARDAATAVMARRREPGRMVGHYRLIEPIGTGGMGEVFLAQDLALGREAAIKLLPADFSPDLRVRLLREAESSARLQHPAIATFYQAGEADDETFIAMEFVRGRTLRQCLADGPLPVADALAITRCLLEALAHAHAAGLLHRDIKPENVVVTARGAAKLLDFGIALPLAVRPTDATVRWDRATPHPGTSAGLVGTVGYVAPEQVAGGVLDARTDVFQVGTVLYEMLTGRPAFGGSSMHDRLTAVMTGSPDLTAVSNQGLEDLLRHALAHDPAERYAGAAVFLRSLLALTGDCVGTTLPKVVAVIDFGNRSNAPELDWIGSALGDGLHAELARLDGLALVRRDKVQREVAAAASPAAIDPLAIGLRLGCGWVAHGEFRSSGGSLDVSVRLLEVATGVQTAAAEVPGALHDLMEVSPHLLQTVARALDVAGTTPGRTRRGVPLEAHELYQRARLLIGSFSKGALDDARHLLERAIEIDEHYEDALAALASAEALRSIATGSTEDLHRAPAHAERAIVLDPGHAEAHVWKGYALWRLETSETAWPAFRRALELDPSHSTAHYFAGVCLVFDRRRAEGLRLLQRAVDLGSGHGIWWLALGTAHLGLDRRREALYSFTRARNLEGTVGRFPTAGAAAYVADVLRLDGLLDKARAEALAGIEAAECSDHAYRDTFRAFGLEVLGRVALDQHDDRAAEAAFTQILAQAKGRPRTRSCGHLVVQALGGLARATGEGRWLDDACELFETQTDYSCEQFFGAMNDQTLFELALAAHELSRPDQARALAERAREAGSLRVLPDPSPTR